MGRSPAPAIRPGADPRRLLGLWRGDSACPGRCRHVHRRRAPRDRRIVDRRRHKALLGRSPLLPPRGGNYHLSKPGVDWSTLIPEMFQKPCQFTIPHNIMGTPAMSLPLAMHSTGVPIGVQIAARPAEEHVLLQLGRALEEAMPWRSRVPPLHVSRL